MPVEIKVLILPKFESGEMSGDYPGEAQYYYEHYCMGGQEYDIPGALPGHKLYLKNGVALCLTGMGKANAAQSLTAILLDKRFDLSRAYIMSVGCAGTAMGYGVMGDVFLISCALDFDMGHRIDIRELQPGSSTTWFHDKSYDEFACYRLDDKLISRLYSLVEDTAISSTPKTRAFMHRAFDGAAWAVREPRVLLGTSLSSDNYWKGLHEHNNALLMAKTYNCPEPYAVTEMEDAALASVLSRFGLLERFIILRAAVNMDVFTLGESPESLWSEDFHSTLLSDDSAEAADIFPIAMENNFKVGRRITDALLAE